MSAQSADEQLLDLLRTDYRSAFKHLYREYFRMVEYFITKNSGNAHDAEDVFQETMVALFSKSRRPDFGLSCALKTYVYSVARNLWLKRLRDTKREFRITDYEKYENVGAEEMPEGDEARHEKVKKAMEQLGEGCRKILVLFYYQKMDMQQIAEQLGYTNADNAKNQKYKCLQQLKSKLV